MADNCLGVIRIIITAPDNMLATEPPTRNISVMGGLWPLRTPRSGIDYKAKKYILPLEIPSWSAFQWAKSSPFPNL